MLKLLLTDFPQGDSFGKKITTVLKKHLSMDALLSKSVDLQSGSLIHLFPMHPFSTPEKLQKTLRFSGCRERGHLEQNGLMYQSLNINPLSNTTHEITFKYFTF